jgi:hypothetical protein
MGVSERAPNGHHLPAALPRSTTSNKGNSSRWPLATTSTSTSTTTFFSKASTSTPGFQTSEMSPHLASRISVQERAPGTLQSVPDAAVYILHLPSAVPGATSQSLLAHISAELKAHMGVLRANRSATLVLMARLLPEPGTVEPHVEAIARLRDLSLLQLSNEREIDMAELLDMLNGVKDSMGHLVVVNKLRSRNSATVALGVKYQGYTDRREL